MKKKKKKLLLTSGAIMTALAAYTIYEFSKKPGNNPKAYMKQVTRKHKVVACLGDSNTQGTMAHNFVNDLSKKMGDQGYDFINAGVNGDLVYNVLSRVNEVIKCEPDYVIILIGTNDILAQLNKPNEVRFEIKKHLPQKPSEEWFIKNLNQLIATLKLHTNAQLAILSLPLISEDTDSKAFTTAIEYSQQIYKVAQEAGIKYLPLNETQLNYLQTHRPNEEKEVKISMFNFFISSFKHYVLRKSWEDISKESGLMLTIDTIHQNEIAALMIEQLIVEFLKEDQTNQMS